MPFLLGLVADTATPARADLTRYLGALAIGFDETFLPAGIDVEAWRKQVTSARAAAVELATYVRGAGGGAGGGGVAGHAELTEAQRRTVHTLAEL